VSGNADAGRGPRPRSSPTPPRTVSQRDRFIEIARELEIDDSPEEFERTFGKIVPPKKAGDVASPRPEPAKKP
jgi:hypothetical protein